MEKNKCKQGLQMSFRRDLPHHERASPFTPSETVQQLGGHPKCILTQCWVRARLNFPLGNIGVVANTMLPIRRVVANYYDFADFTCLNAAWSAGWSTTDHKNEVKHRSLLLTGPRGSAMGLKGRSRQGAHRATGPWA